MTAGALLLLTLLGPAAADLGELSVATSQVLPQDDVVLVNDGEDIGFLDKYYPFSFADNLEPATDDLIFPYFLSIYFLPLGWLWAPYVFSDVKPGPDFVLDAIVIVLLHTFVGFIFFPILIIPILGALVFLAIQLVNSFYLMPVALVNAYDRSIKDEGGVRRGRKSKKRKKRRKRRRRSRPEAGLLMPQPVAMTF